MTLVIEKGITLRRSWQPMDPDAAAYITDVEAADAAAGQTGGLEERTKIAIDNFVLGCKADGIWSAIKASCILAGARTLAGALVPLVGTAPTNFNFASGDYNRKTGLAGNASNKYLSVANAGVTKPSNHGCIYASSAGTSVSDARYFMGDGTGTSVFQTYRNSLNQVNMRNGAEGSNFVITGFAETTSSGCVISSFDGVNFEGRAFGVRRINTALGGTASTVALYANLGGTGAYSNMRAAFYSFGTFASPILLDARVTDLINAIGAAIP
jgi:hypothetical protein